MLIDEFCAAFGVWDEVRPYLPLVVDEQEMRLVLALAGREQPSSAAEVASRLGVSGAEAEALLERSFGRCVVNRKVEAGVALYSAADLYARLDHFAKFENWDDIPLEDRRRIDRRFLDAFIGRHRANVERKMQGLEAENALPNDTVLLLTEVEAMIDAAMHIAVQPCDCRRLGQYCGRPVETCLMLDDVALGLLERGHGRRLTRDEAKKLVRWADRKGLMHTSDSEWQTRGLHAICNCCACDCYPFRAARELGSLHVWPRSRYVAAYDRSQCHVCGACVKRCHFQAFYHDGSTVRNAGGEVQDVLYDPARCVGCGLCANACPSGAIVMEPCA